MVLQELYKLTDEKSNHQSHTATNSATYTSNMPAGMSTGATVVQTLGESPTTFQACFLSWNPSLTFNEAKSLRLNRLWALGEWLLLC